MTSGPQWLIDKHREADAREEALTNAEVMHGALRDRIAHMGPWGVLARVERWAERSKNGEPVSKLHVRHYVRAWRDALRELEAEEGARDAEGL